MTISVIIVTYLHEHFIRQAIEGVLMQETNYEYELIIANDCSPDNTDIVVADIIANHPKGGLIRNFIQDINVGMIKNFIFGVNKAEGKYIALCEGDDYWSDPFKLQKQVDFLERNSDCIVCHHWQKNAVKINNCFVEVDSPKDGHGYYPAAKSSIEAIFSNKMRVKTRTILFRNIISEDFFPSWFFSAAFGDVPLSFLLGKHGNFGFIDEPMAVYRITNEGASTAGLKELGQNKFRIQHYKNWIEIWDHANALYAFKYNEEASKTIKHFYANILSRSLKSMSNIIKFNQFDRKSPFFRKSYFSAWILFFYCKNLFRNNNG